MAEFYISLSNSEIAAQIATLLNAYNQLYARHNAYTIKSSASNYFIEVGRIGQGANQVIGCIGLLKEFSSLSKIHHIAVHPNFRRLGIARRLINIAIQNCETSHVYMTIREDNLPSLRMASSLGFNFIDKKWSRNHDHMVITAGRRTILCHSLDAKEQR